MGLSKIASVFVVGLLLSILLGIAACHKQPQQNFACSPGPWCQIGSSSIYYAYVPGFQDPSCGTSDCPEFVILRMPNSVYQGFYNACQQSTSNGVTWLNSNAPVFSKLLNRIAACPQTPPSATGSQFTFMTVPHWPNSTASPAGYPQTSP